jgi:hypothetical protein
MSYGAGAALQAAVFGALSADAAVTVALGGAIFDAMPAGVLPETYAILGPEEVRSRGDSGGAVARHDFTVSVVSSAAGFSGAKAAAAAISDVLNGADLVLARGALSDLSLFKTRATRLKGGQQRRIDLRFRARIDDF